MFPPPPRSTLFPYTTLFRSYGAAARHSGPSETSAQMEDLNFSVVLPSLTAIYRLNAEEARLSPGTDPTINSIRSEEHTSELQSQSNLVCRLLLEKKNK